MNKKAAVLLFALLSTGAPLTASAKTARPASKPAGSNAQALAAREQFKRDFIDSTKNYQASIQALVKSYSEELDALSARNSTIKDLFSKGLVSRVEMDKSDAAVAEARVKIDGLKKELTSADTALKAAMNPTAVPESSSITASTNWTTGNARIDGLIRLYGGRYGVDPYLVCLVMRQESGFNSSATSSRGAQGLMQLMPATAARYGVTNRLDAAQSIRGGAHYLSDLLQLFNGNVSLALAGYNAGEGAVMKYGNHVPPYEETRYYVRNISAKYKHPA